MNFIERAKPDTKITVMPKQIPYVLIHTVALQKMFTYTDLCAQEVGWLGTAHREGNEFHITDTFLFDQEVHATTTEITPEGLEAFATELLQQADGVKIWNNLKMWGHSHVNMGVTPSGQDDKQMEEFSQVGHDWFIRLICNKKGELSIDVYDYAGGMIFKNVAWERLMSPEEEEIANQLLLLQEQLKAISTVGLEDRTPIIKSEMDKKVRKKVTAVSTVGKAGGMNGHASAYGRYVDGYWKSWSLHLPTDAEMAKWAHLIPDGVKKEYLAEVDLMLKKRESAGESTGNAGGNTGSEADVTHSMISRLHEEEDVYKFFNVAELKEIAFASDIIDIVDQMDDYGYAGQFSKQDINMIQSVALSLGDVWEQNYQNTMHLYR